MFFYRLPSGNRVGAPGAPYGSALDARLTWGVIQNLGAKSEFNDSTQYIVYNGIYSRA